MKYETGGVELDLFFLIVSLFLKYPDFSNFSTKLLKEGMAISMKFISRHARIFIMTFVLFLPHENLVVQSQFIKTFSGMKTFVSHGKTLLLCSVCCTIILI